MARKRDMHDKSTMLQHSVCVLILTNLRLILHNSVTSLLQKCGVHLYNLLRTKEAKEWLDTLSLEIKEASVTTIEIFRRCPLHHVILNPRRSRNGPDGPEVETVTFPEIPCIPGENKRKWTDPRLSQTSP